jgi:hypothetical protein
MAIRYRPSDFTRGGQGGCPACSGVQADVISGDLRIESTAGGLPGKTVWPLLGCLYRSTDTGDGPFGTSRSADITAPRPQPWLWPSRRLRGRPRPCARS